MTEPRESMTPRKLILRHEEAHPDSPFFSSETLKFFGESIRTMKVLKGTTTINDWRGRPHEVYTLITLQRNAPLGPKRRTVYIDADTFDIIDPE